MVKEFENKNYWALILGGSSGLGLASALKLAKHGMNICIVHRDRKSSLSEIEEAFDKIRSCGIQFISFNADATREDKRIDILNELISRVPGIKIKCLLHSLSRGNLKAMVAKNDPELQNDDFHLTIDAMAISLYDWTKAVFKSSIFANGASILSFTSEGSARAWKYYGAVSAAKAALEAITRNIALEFAPYDLRANCIQAGITDTPSLRMIPGSEDLIAHSLERNPYKRLTLAEDVANVVYLLCKKEAKWINGTILTVDGGEHIS